MHKIKPKGIDPSKTFFTSDPHFGHKNIPKFAPLTREQGLTPSELDDVMVARWNSIVPVDADVFDLGDLTFYHNYNQIANILRRLNGRHHLILGNHDQIVENNWLQFLSDGLLESIQYYHEEKIDGFQVNMFHFPMAVWKNNHRNAINLYGHCHGSYKAVGKQMDVGWDTNDLGQAYVDHTPGPISWEKIKKHMESRPTVILDHHTSPNSGSM